MDKAFPVDIQSVKKYGVDSWLSEDFEWPISNFDLLNLWDELILFFDNEIIELDKELSDLVCICLNSFHSVLFQYTSSLIVKTELAQKYKLSYDKNNFFYSDLLTDDKINGLNKLVGINDQDFKVRLRVKLNSIKANLVYLIKNFSKGFKEKFYRVNKPVHYEDEYVESQQGRILSFCPLPLFFQYRGMSLEIDKKCNAFIQKILMKLDEIVQKYDFTLDESSTKMLEVFLSLNLKEAHKLKTMFYKKLSKGKKKKIFIQKLGKIYSRSLAIAAKNSGCEVLSVGHGHDFGMAKMLGQGYVELLMASTYFAPSEETIQFFEKRKSQSKLTMKNGASIKSLGTRFFSKLLHENQSPPVHKIRKVMVLEYPLMPFQHKTVGGFWFFQFKMIAEIGRTLKENGFTAVIKRHPDCKGQYEDIYDDIYDESILTPFEEVYNDADAFIFPNIFSTTFPQALLTNKKILIFDLCFKDVHDEMHEFFRSRCDVIQSDFDGKKRITFDKEKMIEFLNEEKEINLEQIKKLLC